jgi:hypothetical protein
MFIPKGYDGNITRRITLFLNFVHHLVFCLKKTLFWKLDHSSILLVFCLKKHCFGNWITLPSSGEGARRYILSLCSTERGILNLCTQLSRCLTTLSLEDGNIQFLKWCIPVRRMKLENLLQSIRRQHQCLLK